MIACYDLARCPPTYDVVAFLAHAELERIRRGDDHIDLHILPGPAGGFRRDLLWPRSIEERVELRENVLVPLCRLLPSVRSIVVDDRRDPALEREFGFNQYLISLPRIVTALAAGSRPLRVPSPPTVGYYQGGKGKYITFTLREAEHHPARNSRTLEWIKAAYELQRRAGMSVLILRDTARAQEVLQEVENGYAYHWGGTATLGSERIDMRARLYANAALNVGISNGPMWMAIFMDAPVLMLRPTTNAAHGGYDDKFYACYGVPRGSQLPTSPPHQRLVWEEDTRDNIVRAVEEMLETAP